MKKNVASQRVGAQLVSATDGSAFTGSVTVSVTGDAGTQATGSVGSGACTHEGNGYHTYAPAQAETNYDLIAFTFTGTGAIPATVQIYTGFPQTGDNYARLGAPAGASVSADVAAVKSDTAAILVDTATIDTAGEIATAVWSADATSYQTQGTFGQAIGDPGADTNSIYKATVTDATGATVGVDVAAVLADTGTDGVIVASIATGGLNAIADAVLDENVTGHIAANSLGARLQLSHSGACQAGGSGTTIVLASTASSVDDYYNGDLIFGWVTADRTNFFSDYISDYTGSTRTATVTGIPVSPGATYTYVVVPGGTIPGASAPTAADVADAVWDEALSGHVTTGTAGQLLSFLKIRTGTAQAGGASTITLDASASATNDLYNYNLITILSGTGAGQTRQISDYVGSSKVATVNLAWITVPSSDSVFLILPGGLDAATVAAVADAVWDEARSGHATAGSFGEYVFADATRLSGDATAADNAESFFDGTGYAGTNNVIPSVTTVGTVNTLTTYTGNTPQTGDTFARLGAPAGASVSADVAAVKVDTAATLVDTAEIGAAGAGLTALATAANLATVDTVVDAIKVKTDSLTFTKAGEVDSNVQSVNGTTLVGDGSVTPWGP